ncbi:hypothetical protein BDW62DRAFT_23021 [Aspergillus aurantiobrunneus]
MMPRSSLFFDKPERRREHEPCLEGLFGEQTRKIIQDIFNQDLLRQLPLEILFIICHFSAPCWYLILLVLAAEAYRRSLVYESMLPRDIYLSQISTTQLQSTHSTEVQHLELPVIIERIILSVDTIGVRGIQFLDCDSRPKSDGSPWYKILEIKRSSNGIGADVTFDVMPR